MSIAQLRHTSIRRKLLTLALAAGLAFFTVSALYVLSWRDLKTTSARVSSTYIPTLRDGAAALVSVSALGTELFRYVNQIEPSAYKVADALEGARAALQHIAGSDIPPEIRANIESLLPQVAAQEDGLQRLTVRVERDDVLGIGEQHTRMAAEAGMMLRGVERINGQLLDSIVRENRSSQETSLQRAATAAALSLLCIVAALLYMGLVRRDLESGLAELREAARRYASGETAAIVSLDRKDEVGQLSRYLNQLSAQVREIEAQLRERLKFINDVFDSVPLSLAFRDIDGRFRMVNRSWEQSFSYRREDTLGKTLAELGAMPGANASDASRSAAEDQRALALGPGKSTEPREVLLRGRLFLQTRSVISNAQGDLIGLLVTGLDITEQKRHETEAANNAKFIQDLIESVPLSLAFRDMEGRFRLVNRTWEQYFGFSREETLGKTPADLAAMPGGTDASEVARIAHADQRALDLGPGRSTEPREIVLRGRHQTHSRHYLQSRTAMGDAQGNLTGVLITGLDTTAQHELQQVLETQRQRLELVVRASRAGIVDWDGVTRKGWYSDRYKELLGFAADTDTSSWTFFDRVHPEDREWVRAGLIEHLKGENPATRESLMREFRMLRADGSTVWVQTMGLSLRSADGRSARFLSAVTDVSERRAQEEALREQMELTRDLIRALPNPLFLKDEQFRFVHVNPAWEKVAACPAEKAIGKLIPEVYPPEYAEEFLAQDRALLAQGVGIHSIEVSIPGRSGPRQYILSKSLLRRDDGSLRGLIGSMTDITRLKRTEAELRASREEALQAAQAKAAFLAAMSHEIRTPLNGVLGMAGLLEGTRLEPEQREYVETIQVSGDALLTVINDILDYSKIESGRMELEHEPLEPVRAIEESLEILGARARAKGLELIAETADELPPWVSGDLARLRQVLVNLVGNAVKFTDAGEVVVTARAPAPGLLEFAVRDTGIGIPADRIGPLFDAFSQFDVSTTRKYGGTGLGLAISRRLVELMGGELRAESEPGRGSTFTFTVHAQACAPLAPQPASPASADALRGKRLLVVDDNPTNRRILAHQLERWGALQIAESSAAAALERLKGDRAFDAALFDYHMPGMDGVMLAREVRRRGLRLPIVLLSSSMYRRAEEAEAGLFAAQLLKPIRQQQLQAAIAAALAGTRFAPGPVRRTERGDRGLAERVPLRILVADDVEVNRRLAVALLRNFGYAADAVETGREAIEAAASGGYDLVLMDVQMPDVDGLEATRQIRQRMHGEGPRIVALTASAMAGDRERCLAAGMDDYLAKPLQPQALRAALEQVGRGAARQAGRKRTARPAGAIDWSRIESLRPFDADGSMVAGAIAAFLADAPGRIRAICEAHAAHDAAGLAAAAHALKGAAANIGAARLQELSQGIEALAREGRPQDAAKAIGGLEKSLAAARAALAKGKASPGN